MHLVALVVMNVRGMSRARLDRRALPAAGIVVYKCLGV